MAAPAAAETAPTRRRSASKADHKEQHAEEKKRRRAVQALLETVASCVGGITAGGITAEALICSFPRFISPDTMLRLLKRSVVHEANPEKVQNYVRFLGVWVKLRGETDFRRGSSRLEALLGLLDEVAARAPRTPPSNPFEENDSSPLQIALNRVKLCLIAGLLSRTSISAFAAHSTPSAPAAVAKSNSGSTVEALRLSVDSAMASSTPKPPKRMFATRSASGLVKSVRQTASLQRNPLSSRSTALKLFSFTPVQIAEELTIIDHQLFSAVPLDDFLEKRWENKKRPSRVRDLIERSNNLSDWVASHILVQSTVAAQTHVVQLFIEVCKWCETLGDYFACSGIFGGFNKWCISRLTKTWKIKHSHKLLHAHIHLVVSEDKNYANYRSYLAEKLRSGKPCVPHVGVFLRDLTFIEDGNLDFVNGEMNTKKIALIGDIIEQIRAIQVTKFPFQERTSDIFLIDRLRTLPRRDDAWLEKRSKELRPMAPGGASEDVSFASASTKSEDSSEVSSIALEDVADLSDVSSQSAGSGKGGSKNP